MNTAIAVRVTFENPGSDVTVLPSLTGESKLL